jgi:hypothetical protein
MLKSELVPFNTLQENETMHSGLEFTTMSESNPDTEGAGQEPQMRRERSREWHRPVVAIMPLADTPANPGSAHDGVGPAGDTLC